MSNNPPENTKPSLNELFAEALTENSQNWERVAKLEHSVGILINYLDATVKDAFRELVERVEALEARLDAESSYNQEQKERQ